MRYRVTHISRYTYGRPVELAAHMLHLRPRPLSWQRVLSEGIAMEPAGARRRDAEDHFGNVVTWLFYDRPHANFVVTSRALVDVSHPAPPSGTPPWESVVAAAGAPGAGPVAEYRFDSPMVPAVAEAAAFAKPSFPAGRPILEALVDLNARINADFRFRSGVTTISTPVAQVMKRREGVCQDFTHVMISALRGLGVPARYNSGYIRTRPPPGQKRRVGADQSHAWVGAWLGPEHGWVDLDPTNAVVVRNEHVVLGWGRDYGDISPVQGIILGGGAHRLSVSVDLAPDED